MGQSGFVNQSGSVLHGPLDGVGQGRTRTVRDYTYVEGKTENIAIMWFYFFVIKFYFRTFAEFTV